MLCKVNIRMDLLSEFPICKQKDYEIITYMKVPFL
jgi:hypothetical protein